MTKLEMYDEGYLLGEQLIEVIKYQFVGFGIICALLVILIFTIAWTKNV